MIMSGATDPGQYPTIETIFDPTKFLRDTTFKLLIIKVLL
jgi:hypothetical protein